MCVLFSSQVFAAGYCTIAFENEVSENSDHKALYEEVIEFKHVLLRKGYKLKSMVEGEPHYDAFLSLNQTGTGYSMFFHSTNRPQVRIFDSSYLDDDQAVEHLFTQLPSCRVN